MEVACNVACLRSVKNMPRISFWNTRQLALLNCREQDELRYIIDNMGILSAQAQHLRVPITDYNRLRAGPHNLYLCTSGIPGTPDFILVKGMLKVGVKNLYIRKDDGLLVEMAPLCVLDFYVHENHQRIGLGHELFEAMCQHEKKRPHELGIDRPSAKLHSFLAKYYNLTDFLPQANQFVVFKDYFGQQKQDSSKSTSRLELSQDRQDSASLMESMRRDKVLHGRRAKKGEVSDCDMVPFGKPTVSDMEKSDLGSFGNPSQIILGRRQSRRLSTPGSVSDNVHDDSNLGNSQRHLLSSPPLLPSEREIIKPRNIVVGQQKYPSNQDSKTGHGRRSARSTQSVPGESKKKTDKGYVRYPSPPTLPSRLEESKEESSYNPTKLPRRETTRARLFHEDQSEPRSSPQQAKPLKYPYWTENPEIFDTKKYYRNSRIELTPIPPSFHVTRSCYHAGMQGCGAAEAMGYHTRAVT